MSDYGVRLSTSEAAHNGPMCIACPDDVHEAKRCVAFIAVRDLPPWLITGDPRGRRTGSLVAEHGVSLDLAGGHRPVPEERGGGLHECGCSGDHEGGARPVFRGGEDRGTERSGCGRVYGRIGEPLGFGAEGVVVSHMDDGGLLAEAAAGDVQEDGAD